MTVGTLCKFLFSASILLFGPLDRIQKALEKKEYEKAEELIIRGYEKEPDNPGFSYYHAVLLFTPDYSGFQPDSARIVISASLKTFQESSDEIVEDLLGDGVGMEEITQLSDSIRDYLFRQTVDSLSLASIASFRAKYLQSPYEPVLIFKRDSIIFKETCEVNSIEGFSDFIEGYPSSVFVRAADSLRDQLRYGDLIANGELKDYYAFIDRYPESRWREPVEEYIFRISTASSEAERFIDFINLSTIPSLKKRAADVLYYTNAELAIQHHPYSDSLRVLYQLVETKLFPVMDQNRFGFHNDTGKEFIPYQYEEIHDEIKCSPTSDDWIFVVKNGNGLILNKLNQTVLENIDGYQSISDGLALVSMGGENFIYHKSGYRVMDDAVQDAEVVHSKWIKTKKDGYWGLYSFSGVAIAENRYDDISVLGNFYVFEKEGLMAVTVEQEISKEIEQRGLTLEFKFDDLELVNDSTLIGFKGDREGMLNDRLDFLIPWGDHEIFPDPNAWYLRSNRGYLLYNSQDQQIGNQYYPYLESNYGWLVLKAAKEDWILIQREAEIPPSRDYDSIKLINNHTAFILKDNRKSLIFSSGEEIEVGDHQLKSFTSKPEFISLRKKNLLEIYNERGEQIISGKFQEAAFINDTLIRVSIRGKQGIIDIHGDYLLNPLFDALNEKDGLVFTLLDGKIGCFDLYSKTLIDARYEARIEKMNQYYLATRGGKSGIINSTGEEVISFSYDQITYWNDTSYLVRIDESSFVINSSEEELTEPMEDLQLLFENGTTRIFRFVREGRFGLASTKDGLLLTPEFTDILNIGDEENPLFFADQHLSKAGFHVVSYVNDRGDLIFSKAYRKEEFDSILCDD